MGKFQALTNEAVVERLKSTNFQLLEPYVSCRTRHKIKCLLCGKEYRTTLARIVRGLTNNCGCLKLGKRKGLKFVTGTAMCLIKRSAKERNLEFKVTIEYLEKLLIKQQFKCAISGLDIQIVYRSSKNESTDTTASLDRIDSTKGYIVGNVQWVHKHVNMMKQNYDQTYFIELCKKIVDNTKELQHV